MAFFGLKLGLDLEKWANTPTKNSFTALRGCSEGRLFTALKFLVFSADRITRELDASTGDGDRTPPSIPKYFELASLNREAVDNLH